MMTVNLASSAATELRFVAPNGAPSAGDLCPS